uniref:Transcription factor lfc1 n=1 Tax=Flammulina velutipes TaxID=38945 RepID=LFC1_FLAVE|nr:Large fruitingbody cap 1 [Flammulina velutipes]
MSYPSQGHYLPPEHQYLTAATLASHGHEHLYAHSQLSDSPPRQDLAQRKRPKYTRSKTGCLTCRMKKIKCDETKPTCARCTHGQRECTWPDASSPRRRAPLRRGSIDDRPSTAGSSVSDDSSPSIRNSTPPRRFQMDSPESGLLPPPSARRNMDPFLQLPPVVAPESRHQHIRPRPPPFTPPQSEQHNLTLSPDPSEYCRYDRYDATYAQTHHLHSSHSSPSSRAPHMVTGIRGMGYSPESVHQWNSPPLLSPIESSSYQHYPLQERGMVGPSDNHHFRYQ